MPPRPVEETPAADSEFDLKIVLVILWGRLLICGRLAIGLRGFALQVSHNDFKYIFAARISLKQKPFNQTPSPVAEPAGTGSPTPL
jgi:hypothetical protein